MESTDSLAQKNGNWAACVGGRVSQLEGGSNLSGSWQSLQSNVSECLGGAFRMLCRSRQMRYAYVGEADDGRLSGGKSSQSAHENSLGKHYYNFWCGSQRSER